MELKSARRRRVGQSPGRIALVAFSGLVFLFLMLPLFIVFPISFSSASYLQFPPPGYSLRWYEAYVNDPVWLAATLRSLKIAACTTVLATFLGTLLAGPGGSPRPVDDREDANAALTTLAGLAGVWCVRVHEARKSLDALKVVQCWLAGFTP